MSFPCRELANWMNLTLWGGAEGKDGGDEGVEAVD